LSFSLKITFLNENLFTQHKVFTDNKTEVAEKSDGSWPTEGKTHWENLNKYQ
jgi:hypothetical protein